MKRLIALLLLVGAAVPAFARYEVFLSTAPNNKYRVAVTQEVLRRVGDQVFFEYPIYVVNKKGARILMVEKGTVPYIQETPRGTFTVDFDRAKFEWNEDSTRFFMFLEVVEGEKRVYLVDIVAKTSRDVTDELAPKMLKKVAAQGRECERPAVSLVKWHKKDLAILKLSSPCVKRGDEKAKTTEFRYWSLYDTAKKKLVKDCPDCDEKDALKTLTKEPKKKKPKPTPTPEETPAYR